MADKTNAPAAGETWPPDDLVLFLGPAATAVVTVADGGSIPAKTLPLPGPFLPYFPFFVKNLSIYRVEGGIKLGPVLGIIVEVPPQAMYPRDLSFYQRLINYSNSRGLLTFLFTPADLDLKENIITGYTAVGDNTWRLGSFPLPDVVYNRVGFLTPQTREAFPTVYTFLNNHPGLNSTIPGIGQMVGLQPPGQQKGCPTPALNSTPAKLLPACILPRPTREGISQAQPGFPRPGHHFPRHCRTRHLPLGLLHRQKGI